MRILHVSFAYPPFLSKGGPPEKVRAIGEGLAERGHAVTVLTVNHRRRQRTIIKRSNAVEVVYLRTLARHRSATLNPSSLTFCRSRTGAFDVVHVYGLYDLLGPVAGYFCGRRRVPYVIEPLGMYPAMARSLIKKHVYMLAVGTPLMKHAARVVATSEREREHLVGAGFGSVALRRNGVDLRAFETLPPHGEFRRRWKIAREEPVTLYLGRLTKVKHPEMLLEAFANAGSIGTLVFVGPDEDGNRRRLQATASRSKLDDRVIFTGPLYGQDKASALVDADVFVLPSESESFGNSVVEAMACGTPVIVTDRCGIAPYVADRGGLVVPLDVLAIADALERLFRDDGLRARLGVEGSTRAKDLSWDEPVLEMERIYEDVVAEAGGRRRPS
jgi:glycosyltransferase involved in cell wall biosynthesis